MDQTIFSKLELECGMEKENERLKNQIALLEKENELLKQKEVERTKLNMEAECACIYSHGDGIYVYVELEQMDRLLANCSGLKYNKHDQNEGSWGFSIKFVSIASARTCLLIMDINFPMYLLYILQKNKYLNIMWKIGLEVCKIKFIKF